MAFLDDVLSGWGTTVLLGVGVALAAPALLPTVGTVIRPLAKGLIKGGFFIADSLKGLTTASSEQISDLVAEAQAEYQNTTPREKSRIVTASEA
jgi:hypothetical protein